MNTGHSGTSLFRSSKFYFLQADEIIFPSPNFSRQDVNLAVRVQRVYHHMQVLNQFRGLAQFLQFLSKFLNRYGAKITPIILIKLIGIPVHHVLLEKFTFCTCNNTSLSVMGLIKTALKAIY